jgi:hypothetical protein
MPVKSSWSAHPQRRDYWEVLTGSHDARVSVAAGSMKLWLGRDADNGNKYMDLYNLAKAPKICQSHSVILPFPVPASLSWLPLTMVLQRLFSRSLRAPHLSCLRRWQSTTAAAWGPTPIEKIIVDNIRVRSSHRIGA